MELISKLRWIIFIALAVLFLVLVGWGLFSIANSIFNPSTSVTDESSQIDVVDDELRGVSSALFTIDGPIIANEEHRSLDISVSSSVVSMKVYKTYTKQVISEKSYLNTPESYEAFLSSLGYLEVTNRKKDTTVENDFEESGICPTGRRYIVELDDLRRWGTSCSAKQGTADFSMKAVRSLFSKQVPDYRELVRGTQL